MWMKLYKLLKKVVNINTEKKTGYLWKALHVSIHHGTILRIENSKSIIFQFRKKKEIENRSCEKWNDCFGAKRKIANV